MHKIVCLKTGIFGAILALLAVFSAHAQTATSWMENEQGAVRLIAESLTIGAEGGFYAGLQFNMRPGWHVYWRSPGDAGYAPRIDWAGSQNLAAAEFLWPAPMRFSFGGIETAGYENELVLPIKIRAQKTDAPLVLRGKLDYLTCNQICVPHQYDLSLTIQPGATLPSPEQDLIQLFLARVPDAGERSLMAISFVQKTGDKLLIGARGANAFMQPELLLESRAKVHFSRPKAELSGGGKEVLFRVDVAADDAQNPPNWAAEPLVLTLVDGTRGLQHAAMATEAVSGGLWRDHLWMILIGILGGLILNVMPCVLPVLSIKLMQITAHRDKARLWVRQGFLAAAAGILASFWALAAIAAGLKFTGMQVGWGMQFQQPLFLAAMTLLLLIFAANMWGFFEIRLPHFIARLGKIGQARDGEHSLAGEFLTGALATLLATPCSAPFLGTALGFALSQGTAQIFIMFSAIGIGLALPYILGAAFPGFVQLMPRPGRWMNTIRKFLALCLLATALWLGWIAAMQIRPVAAMAEKMQPTHLAWQKFDAAQIKTLVAQGKIVFVDITADWCLTCQVNERFVLETEAGRTLLSRPNLVLMRGDWTKPDPAISAYLASFKRYGIPFNAVYSPQKPDGEPLPELLSFKALEQGLR